MKRFIATRKKLRKANIMKIVLSIIFLVLLITTTACQANKPTYKYYINNEIYENSQAGDQQALDYLNQAFERYRNTKMQNPAWESCEFKKADHIVINALEDQIDSIINDLFCFSYKKAELDSMSTSEVANKLVLAISQSSFEDVITEYRITTCIPDANILPREFIIESSNNQDQYVLAYAYINISIFAENSNFFESYPEFNAGTHGFDCWFRFIEMEEDDYALLSIDMMNAISLNSNTLIISIDENKVSMELI